MTSHLAAPPSRGAGPRADALEPPPRPISKESASPGTTSARGSEPTVPVAHQTAKPDSSTRSDAGDGAGFFIGLGAALAFDAVLVLFVIAVMGPR